MEGVRYLVLGVFLYIFVIDIDVCFFFILVGYGFRKLFNGW